MKSNVSIFSTEMKRIKFNFVPWSDVFCIYAREREKKLVHKQKKWISKHRFGVCN